MKFEFFLLGFYEILVENYVNLLHCAAENIVLFRRIDLLTAFNGIM